MTKKRPLTKKQEDIQPGVLLLLQVPRSSEQNQDSMTQLLDSLHSLLRLPLVKLLRTYKRERISLEITANGSGIGFYVWAPKYLKSHVVEYVHTHYPLIAITEVEDYLPGHARQFASTYAVEITPDQAAGEDLLLKKIVDALAVLNAQEAASLQLLIRPAKTANGKAFDTQLRAVYHSNLPQTEAMLRMQGIIAPYKATRQSPVRLLTADELALLFCVGREFAPDYHSHDAAALARMYHLSHAAVANPKILWLKPQSARPPEFLLLGAESDPANELSPIGSAQVRGEARMFGLRRSDRGRHVAVYGEKGVGKTSLLELLAISDIYGRYGIACIDTDGTLSGELLARIPYERAGEVVYIDFTDEEYPPAFNPLELQDPSLKMRAVHELVIALRPLFGEEQPATEMLLRQVLSILMDAPETTLLDIPRFLQDKAYRSQQLVHSSDVAARTFWQIDFAAWRAKNGQGAPAIDAIVGVIQRVAGTPQLAHIVGQPVTSFSLSRIVQQGGILLVRCGARGQDAPARLLASLLGVSLHMAVLSRSSQPAQQRQPFYVYDDTAGAACDEWHVRLHESRRLAVGYVFALQPGRGRQGLLGSAGTRLCFRVPKVDIALARLLGPDIMHYDITTLTNRQFIASVSVEGEHIAAFAALSLTLPERSRGDVSQAIIEYCRGRYNSSKALVENYLKEKYSAWQEPAPEDSTGGRPKRKGSHAKNISDVAQVPDASIARSIIPKQKRAKKASAVPKVPKKHKATRSPKKQSQLESGILRDMELLDVPDAKTK
ncbi:MAG: hypothetical protein WBP26_06205 [Candidatus Saccharimonadales bacterium]